MVEHLVERGDGTLDPLTNAGAFALKVLHLHRDSCRSFRKRRASVQRRLREYRELIDADEATVVASSSLKAVLRSVLDDLEQEFARFR
jgi:hypothetical protein